MKRYILGILILVFGIFIITGCNNKKTSTKKENTSKVETTKKKKVNKDSIVGSYEIIELKDEQETFDKKTIESLHLDYSFEVKEDKTAVMRFSDTEENLTYDNKYFTNEKEKIEYKYDKGKLVLFNDDTTLTFQKK